MTFTEDFLTGAAEYLDAENVAAFNPAGGYRATDIAITFDKFHTTIDKAISIALYPVEDTLGTDAVVGLQLWVRGGKNERRTAKAITDRCVDALHGLQRVVWGGTPIVLVVHKSTANHGPDANGREELSANFYCQITRTGQHRAD